VLDLEPALCYIAIDHDSALCRIARDQNGIAMDQFGDMLYEKEMSVEEK
jgi:hypothetical protein